MSAPYTPSPNERDENLELVRQMGADWYDPIPTEQYACFEDPDFRLTDRGHQLLACIRSHTIRARKGGRTPYAAKDGKTLKEKRIAALLGWPESSVFKVWKELEEHGLVRKDQSGRLWLCGRVSWKKQSDGGAQPPDDPYIDSLWEKFCTDNFAGYLAAQFQRLAKSERPCLHQDIETWDAYQKQVEAQVMAAAREQVQRRRDTYLAQRYRAKVRRFERKADGEKPEPLIQLSLLREPELSVQNSGPNSVQGAESAVYKTENGGVQRAHIRNSDFSDQSDSPTQESDRRGNSAGGNPSSKNAQEEPPGWGRFCELAEQAGMHLGRSEYARRRAEYAALPVGDQIAACRGIEERIECGQYDPVNRPAKTPFMRNYLFDRKWEDPPLRVGQKGAPDTAFLDLVEQGVPEDEALKIVEERNGKRKTGALVHHAGEGGDYAG